MVRLKHLRPEWRPWSTGNGRRLPTPDTRLNRWFVIKQICAKLKYQNELKKGPWMAHFLERKNLTSFEQTTLERTTHNEKSLRRLRKRRPTKRFCVIGANVVLRRRKLIDTTPTFEADSIRDGWEMFTAEMLAADFSVSHAMASSEGSNPINQCDQTCSSLVKGDEGFYRPKSWVRIPPTNATRPAAH